MREMVIVFLSLSLMHINCKQNHSNKYIPSMEKGMIVEKKINNISNFKISNVSNVEFIDSDLEVVKIFGSEDHLLQFLIDTNNNVLNIYPKKNSVNQDSKVTVKIYTKSITSLNGSAIGSIIIPAIVNPMDNTISLKSLGSVEMEVDTEKINCSISAVGFVEIKGSVKSGVFNLSAIANLNTSHLNKGNVKVITEAVGMSSN